MAIPCDINCNHKGGKKKLTYLKNKKGAGQIQFTIALVMFALFSIAVIGFATTFANDNGSAVSISSDSQITTLYNNTYGNLSSFRENTNKTYSSIINNSIASGSQTTATGGQFALTPFSLAGIAFGILEVGYVKIFGSGAFGIFLSTFLGVIIFIIAMLIWKTWGGRSPD